MDSLRTLSAFVRATAVRSFTEHGPQLSLSASAIGKAIAGLRIGPELDFVTAVLAASYLLTKVHCCVHLYRWAGLHRPTLLRHPA